MQQRNDFRTTTGISFVLATPVFALATWVIFTRVGGQPLLADAGGPATSVGPVQVAVVSTVAATLGMLLLAWSVRRLRRGRLIWVVTACGILVVSLVGALSGLAAHDRMGLLALHVVTGTTVILGGLLATRTVSSQSTAQGRTPLETGIGGR